MAIKNLSAADFETTVADNSVVVIDFWASWCGPCRAFPVGDDGGHAWDRRNPTVAVSPLVAASLAHYGAVSHGRRPRKPARSSS